MQALGVQFVVCCCSALNILELGGFGDSQHLLNI